MEGLIALIIAIVGLAAGIVTYMTKLKSSIGEIHVMVNSRMAEALQRIDQLEALLVEKGIASPDKLAE